ncbi:hypothetical protein ACFE33_09325 [Falsihalocynthiibacter sp. SS001]|uniref:hypothetical protein n=1 Tax=Falsihalocynthiibacter sp. SS001 TaxID=3349698 RepID=UPI0036D393F7
MSEVAYDKKLHDPKHVIRESFAMPDITAAECRSIFVDWALNVPAGVDAKVALSALLQHHSDAPADHPMLEVLREGLLEPTVKGRRGGWSGRRTSRS